MGAISFLATKAESLHVFKQNIRCPIYINKNNKVHAILITKQHSPSPSPNKLGDTHSTQQTANNQQGFGKGSPSSRKTPSKR